MHSLIDSVPPALIAVLCLINSTVSILLVRCHFYSPFQKLAQCIIAWVVPVLGAVAIGGFLRSQYNWEKYDTRAYPKGSRKMVGVEVNNAINDSYGAGGRAAGGD